MGSLLVFIYQSYKNMTEEDNKYNNIIIIIITIYDHLYFLELSMIPSQ
jgi:hypothetical protein